MTIEQLQYVCMVAKTHSITLAAERLYVTQQTISKAINKLERELNVVLLSRSHKGVALTPEGEVFVKQASEIVDRIEALYMTMCPHMADRQQEGTLLVRMTSYELTLVGTQLLSAFHKKYPKVHLKIAESLTMDTLKQFLDQKQGVGMISVLDEDTGIGTLEDMKRQLSVKILYLDELQIFVSPNNRLARKSEISFGELQGLYAGFGSTPSMVDIMERRYGVKIEGFTDSRNITLIGQAVKEDMAFGVTTKGLAKRTAFFKDYVLLSLSDHPKVQVAFLHHHDYALNDLEKILLEELESIFSTM